MPARAICSKISANKMPSGFCSSNFIVSEAYLQPRKWDFKSRTLNSGLFLDNAATDDA